MFLAILPEWKGRVIGPVGHGTTYAEALASAEIVIGMLVRADREDGRPLPEVDLYRL